MTPYATKQPPSGGFFTPIVGFKGGKGGGGSSRTPREDPDSLHGKAFAKILDMWSEGDIYGPTHGGDGLRDVMLDGTRVKNDDGSVNLPGVSVDMRLGTQAQDPIPGFPSAENTIGVGVDLKASVPWVRSFTDTALSAVRVNLQATQYEVKANGDRVGYRVEYAIDISTDDGPFLEVLAGAFDGKTTSAYPRSHRIDLPRATSNWRVRVRRLTADSTSDLITSLTRIESVVEIIDAKLRYPMVALAGILIDASLFSAVPQRAYDLMGRIVQVPSNYDAFNHTYTGAWDGTFKLSWTDSPPWIFRDLVTNDRYGLGHLVPAGMVDKWSLYEIAQYCDELVPDGFGGVEPRFTCNVYLQEAADAYRVLQDLAGCFRGMAFPAAGSVFASADIPSDPSDWYSFSNSNVRDGKFVYAGTSRSSRYTVAQVSWNDLDDMGRQKVEVVEDQDAIARYGIRSTAVTAFGCTSQGQAHRVGKWLLMTSLMETGTVAFQTALEQARVMPGQVIRIADQHRAGRRIGGRIASASVSVVTVDMAIGVRPGDRLVVNLPSGITQERIVQTAQGQYLTADQTTWTVDSTEITADMIGMPGSTLIIQVTQPFTELPQAEAQWTLESENLSYQTFRVLRIEREDDLWAKIIALEHNPSKYAAIDYGTKLQTKPITIIPPMVQAAPTGITISGYSVIEQGYATHTASIQWQPVANAVAYIVEWRRDNSDWLPAGRTGASSIEVRGIFAGAYVARVRAVNGMEITSNWAYSTETQLEGFTGAPPVLSFLNAESAIFGINLSWGFPDVPSIIGKTEIWMSLANNVGTAQKIDFGYPTNTYMLLGLAPDTTLYFWGRLVDKNGLPGAFYPDTTNGVRGVSRHDAAGYLGYYNGLLNRDSLALSLVEELDTLAAGIGDFTTQITQERELRESADEALASQVDTIAAVANGAAGSIVAERTARQNADETLAQSIETVRAANATTAGQVDTERTARIQGDTVIAQTVDQVRATANGAQAGVNQTSTALASLDGRLQATYTMRAQVNQFGQVYAAAMGLGVYDTGEGLQSSIYFLAERFAFVNNANGVLTTPFVIEGGITYINRAMIGNAWITSAKIESLDAGKVTFGEMSGDRIEVNSLAAKMANVGTAYIGTANIKVANVDTLRLAGMSVVVAASGDAAQEYGGATGNNAISLSIQVPYACTLLVVYEVRIGGIASQQTEPAYIGGNFMPNRGLRQADFKPNTNGDGGSITTGYQTYVTQAGLSGPLQFSVAGTRVGGSSQIYARIALFAIMR